MTKSEIRVLNEVQFVLVQYHLMVLHKSTFTHSRMGNFKVIFFITLSPYNKISTSNVLGPQRMSLTRCNRCSVSKQYLRSSLGSNSYQFLNTNLKIRSLGIPYWCSFIYWRDFSHSNAFNTVNYFNSFL